MTDDAPLPDDELASAYIDDAVDAAGRARVESSPDLLARAEQLAGARRAVAAAPIPDAAQREVHIAHALAALDAAVPISLADRRDRRLRRRLTVLSAAAAIVVVAGVLAVTADRGHDDSLSTASRSAATTAAGATEAQAGDMQNDAKGPPTGAGGAATTAAAAATTTAAASATTASQLPAVAPTDSSYLGTIDENTAAAVLRDASDVRLQGPPACAVPGGTHYVGSATYAGTSVYAFVSEPDESPPRGVLVDMATCTVVADLPLA
jgi:hypothetical protein